MKITRTFEFDTKGVEIGDEIAIFETFKDYDVTGFYKYNTYVISDITISNSAHINTHLVVNWQHPDLGLQQQDLFDFLNFDERSDSFNFYILDINDRVEKEVNKRKEWIKKKLEKEVEELKIKIEQKEGFIKVI